VEENRVNPTAPDDAPRLRPTPLEIGTSVSELVDHAFHGSTAGKLALMTRRLTEQVLARPGTILGLTIDATLIPGGVAISALVPLLQGGYIDWIATTGVNLFHDALFALRLPFFPEKPVGDEPCELCEGDVYLRRSDRQKGTDRLREILSTPDFQSSMGTAALHDRLGAHLRLHEKSEGVEYPALLSTAHELGVPIFNPAPADNPLGTLIADLSLVGNRLVLDTSSDLNFAAALLNAAGPDEGTAIWCLGRGAAANFALQAPDHLRTVLAGKKSTDYSVRLRMAGRGHPLPAAGCEDASAMVDLALSTDLSIALPLMTACILDRVPPRPLKRLGARREDLIDRLRQDQLAATLTRQGPRKS
jgi:deoxyhypusine synthase